MPLARRLATFLSGRLARNMATLMTLRVVDQLLPLATIPFLARVLGPEAWGIVTIAQSLALYSIVTTQYGLEFSGTRAVARSKPGSPELGRFVSSALATQLILGTMVALASLVFTQTIAALAGDWRLVAATLLFGLAQGFYPAWYFIGRERVVIIAMISILCRLGATIGIFLTVRGPGDEWLVMTCYALGITVPTLIGFALIFRELTLERPNLASVRSVLASGAALFVTRLSTMIHTAGNTFLIGLILAPADVAVFAAGEKLCRPLAWLVQPINTALMPRLAHLVGEQPGKARIAAAVATLVLSCAGLGLGVLVWVLAPWIAVFVYGRDPGFDEVVEVMRTMAVIIPLMITNSSLITQWCIPAALDRELTIIVVTATILNVLLVLLIAPRFGPVGVAWVTVIVAACILAGLLVLLRRMLVPNFKELAARLLGKRG